MENEILETLAHNMNFTYDLLIIDTCRRWFSILATHIFRSHIITIYSTRYEILVPNDTLQFGLPGNESWTGVLGLIDRKVYSVSKSFFLII